LKKITPHEAFITTYKYHPDAKYLCENMTETELLKKISDDLDFLKTKILEIEESLELIDSELHPVREEYIERLEEIKKEGTISGSEFEKKFGVKL
jgi:Ni,Fe-hydrogenase III large subunit